MGGEFNGGTEAGDTGSNDEKVTIGEQVELSYGSLVSGGAGGGC